MRRSRGKAGPFIPFIAPTTRVVTRVELTPREQSERVQQRILALQEIERLRERQLAAIREEIAELKQSEEERAEREAIEQEESSDDGDFYDEFRDEGGGFDEDLPDWDSDEFLEEWDEDIDYELFTVLS